MCSIHIVHWFLRLLVHDYRETGLQELLLKWKRHEVLGLDDGDTESDEAKGSPTFEDGCQVLFELGKDLKVSFTNWYPIKSNKDIVSECIRACIDASVVILDDGSGYGQNELSTLFQKRLEILVLVNATDLQWSVTTLYIHRYSNVANVVTQSIRSASPREGNPSLSLTIFSEHEDVLLYETLSRLIHFYSLMFIPQSAINMKRNGEIIQRLHVHDDAEQQAHMLGTLIGRDTVVRNFARYRSKRISTFLTSAQSGREPPIPNTIGLVLIFFNGIPLLSMPQMSVLEPLLVQALQAQPWDSLGLLHDKTRAMTIKLVNQTPLIYSFQLQRACTSQEDKESCTDDALVLLIDMDNEGPAHDIFHLSKAISFTINAIYHQRNRDSTHAYTNKHLARHIKQLLSRSPNPAPLKLHDDQLLPIDDPFFQYTLTNYLNQTKP